ncbi:MAG: hypothetical protein Q9202_007230 [Teloschistes flavicans]
MLQDDDVEKLRKSGKGEGREDELRYRDVALAIYQQELKYTRLGLEDRLTRPDVHQTADPGFTLLTDAMTEEDMLARDTCLAASLSRGADLDTETQSSVDEEIEAFQLSDGNGTGYFSELEEAVQAAAESSQRATTRLDTSRTTLRDCVACLECKSYNDLPRAACGHWYCRTCLTNLFESAFKDDSLFVAVKKFECAQATISSGDFTQRWYNVVDELLEARLQQAVEELETATTAPICFGDLFPGLAADAPMTVDHILTSADESIFELVIGAE